jgi:hypothetical protein
MFKAQPEYCFSNSFSLGSGNLSLYGFSLLTVVSILVNKCEKPFFLMEAKPLKTKSEMESQVAQDLKHIPRGLKGSPQNMLRLNYEDIRKHDISKTCKLLNPKSCHYCNLYRKQGILQLLRHKTRVDGSHIY